MAAVRPARLVFGLMPGQPAWPDSLFAWMSERGSADMQTLRRAWRWARGEAEPPPSPCTQPGQPDGRAFNTYLRALSALALAEVDRDAGRWSAAPAAVVSLPGSELGVLAGSRTPALRDRLAEVSADLGAEIRTHAHPGAPEAVLLRPATAGTLEQLARELDAVFAGCAGRELAGWLPALDDACWDETWAPESTSAELAVFDPATLQFTEATGRPAAGLVRSESFGRTRFLLETGGTWRAVHRDAGIYAELARAGRAVVGWSAGRGGELRVPRSAPLPVLHARAATLCYGVLPTRANPLVDLYLNVPADVAAAICRSLRQPDPTRAGDTARAR